MTCEDVLATLDKGFSETTAVIARGVAFTAVVAKTANAY